MRSTHDHEDRVRYWLTDAEGGGQPLPDKVFMVMRRPKSKVYYCFIKLSGIFLQQDCHIHNNCIFIASAAVCLAWLKIETPNRPLNAVCGQFTLRYTRVNAVSANQRRAKSGEIPDHLIINVMSLFSKVISLNFNVILVSLISNVISLNSIVISLDLEVISLNSKVISLISNVISLNVMRYYSIRRWYH